MVHVQLELFEPDSVAFDDEFFIIEVDEPGVSEAYPLTPVLSALYSVYSFVLVYLLVFGVSAWLGMAFAVDRYLSPAAALGDMFTMMLLMLIVPVYWPFLIAAICCFFVPMRWDTADAKVFGLVVLLMCNLVAFGSFGDISTL